MGQNFFDPFGVPYFFLGEVFLVFPLYDFYFHPQQKAQPLYSAFCDFTSGKSTSISISIRQCSEW